ncbi:MULTISPECIES: CBS domain-containing protein [Halorussus]|uniref:CBS domain-containing protein n=1 Tax=Halorussus TaxID=1070314 RepID=UPI000E210789|nr:MULTISPECIES: CBS domain-containing protein [Halorussus]NHN60794.1 CBS domain-containing protein [Halorussus sp. JP-T4]
MRSFTVGRAFGIPIKLDLTFLLILPVFAWLIGSQVGLWVDNLNFFLDPDLSRTALTTGNLQWILGAAAAVGLFAGVVLHELGHSLVAMRYGFPIDSITLWIFGGIAQLTEQPENWKQEFAIAIAGPAVSVALGVVSYLALFAVPDGLPTVRFLFGYLALMNVALAAFNLLPGFPMDGGRVLRAILGRTRSFAEATRIAAEVGKLFAILLGLFGLFGNWLLIGIAFFIYIGATSEAQQTVMNAAFRDVRVRDVMTSADDLDTVEPDMSVADLMETMFRQRHTGYPVLEDGELVGMVTLDDAREVTEVERDAYTVADVMSRDLKTIPASDDAMSAFEKIQQHGVGRLLVIDAEGELTGLVSRTDLVTAFDIIQKSGRADRITPADQPVSEAERPSR